MGRLGVLLLNLGGPEQLSDVRPFLFNLFADPEIIRIPIAALQKPLAWLISTSRAKKSRANYQKIGGGSPLRRITEAQARALEQQLIAQAADVDVEINGLSSYWLPDSTTPMDQRAGLVLGFAAVPEPAIKAALSRLRQAWQD